MLAHARKIVVDGVEYAWVFSGAKRRWRWDNAPVSGHVVVQVFDGASRRLVVFVKARGLDHEPDMDMGEPPFKGYIAPADVEKIIREGIKQGWDPMSRGKQMTLRVPLELKDYEVL